MKLPNGKQTVFVGLSGGVDSAVAALRLKLSGYQVIGVFIKVWHPEFLKCNWEAERLDAMRVAAHLQIPFLTCDAAERYRQDVGEYFIAEYLAGRTPNPDVMCNQHIKFGAFLDFAKSRNADFVATGHYAQKQTTEDGYTLWRGLDTSKDQSYFLWTLTQEQLKHVLLPIGDTQKTAIRREAEAAGLPVFAKKDSQGICFLGHIDIREFLTHFTDLKEGNVLDLHGHLVGRHHGALIYTVGQRHGFTLTTADTNRQSQYVVARDLTANTITVSPQKPILPKQTSVKLKDVNWIDQPATDIQLAAQFRYRQTPFPVKLTIQSEIVSVAPEINIEQPANGQSCVLYDQDQCLGGGIISV